MPEMLAGRLFVTDPLKFILELYRCIALDQPAGIHRHVPFLIDAQLGVAVAQREPDDPVQFGGTRLIAGRERAGVPGEEKRRSPTWRIIQA